MRALLLFAGVVAVAGGCLGNIGDRGAEDVPEGARMAVPSGARRLTRQEYDNTVRDLLGDDTRPGWAKLPEDALTPFDNDYSTQLVSPALIEAAETLATEVAQGALGDMSKRSSLLPCAPYGVDDMACLREFVATFGRRALRRPLTDEEPRPACTPHRCSSP